MTMTVMMAGRAVKEKEDMSEDFPGGTAAFAGCREKSVLDENIQDAGEQNDPGGDENPPSLLFFSHTAEIPVERQQDQ
jgi:hypothetical protein